MLKTDCRELLPCYILLNAKQLQMVDQATTVYQEKSILLLQNFSDEKNVVTSKKGATDVENLLKRVASVTYFP